MESWKKDNNGILSLCYYQFDIFSSCYFTSIPLMGDIYVKLAKEIIQKLRIPWSQLSSLLVSAAISRWRFTMTALPHWKVTLSIISFYTRTIGGSPWNYRFGRFNENKRSSRASPRRNSIGACMRVPVAYTSILYMYISNSFAWSVHFVSRKFPFVVVSIIFLFAIFDPDEISYERLISARRFCIRNLYNEPGKLE